MNFDLTNEHKMIQKEVRRFAQTEIAPRVDGTLGTMLDITTSVIGQELLVFGTEEQKQKYLITIARGEKIGAFGLTVRIPL